MSRDCVQNWLEPRPWYSKNSMGEGSLCLEEKETGFFVLAWPQAVRTVYPGSEGVWLLMAKRWNVVDVERDIGQGGLVYMYRESILRNNTIVDL